MQMIERMARAICSVDIEQYDIEFGPSAHSVEERVEDNWRKNIDRAKAAIEEMRDPTKAMQTVLSEWDSFGVPPDDEAMNKLIDAALEEKPEC